jgi:hypothetical protein
LAPRPIPNPSLAAGGGGGIAAGLGRSPARGSGGGIGIGPYGIPPQPRPGAGIVLDPLRMPMPMVGLPLPIAAFGGAQPIVARPPAIPMDEYAPRRPLSRDSGQPHPPPLPDGRHVKDDFYVTSRSDRLVRELERVRGEEKEKRAQDRELTMLVEMIGDLRQQQQRDRDHRDRIERQLNEYKLLVDHASASTREHDARYLTLASRLKATEDALADRLHDEAQRIKDQRTAAALEAKLEEINRQAMNVEHKVDDEKLARLLTHIRTQHEADQKTTEDEMRRIHGDNQRLRLEMGEMETRLHQATTRVQQDAAATPAILGPEITMMERKMRSMESQIASLIAAQMDRAGERAEAILKQFILDNNTHQAALMDKRFDDVNSLLRQNATISRSAEEKIKEDLEGRVRDMERGLRSEASRRDGGDERVQLMVREAVGGVTSTVEDSTKALTKQVVEVSRMSSEGLASLHGSFQTISNDSARQTRAIKKSHQIASQKIAALEGVLRAEIKARLAAEQKIVDSKTEWTTSYTAIIAKLTRLEAHAVSGHDTVNHDFELLRQEVTRRQALEQAVTDIQTKLQARSLLDNDVKAAEDRRQLELTSVTSNLASRLELELRGVTARVAAMDQKIADGNASDEVKRGVLLASIVRNKKDIDTAMDALQERINGRSHEDATMYDERFLKLSLRIDALILEEDEKFEKVGVRMFHIEEREKERDANTIEQYSKFNERDAELKSNLDSAVHQWRSTVPQTDAQITQLEKMIAGNVFFLLQLYCWVVL